MIRVTPGYRVSSAAASGDNADLTYKPIIVRVTWHICNVILHIGLT